MCLMELHWQNKLYGFLFAAYRQAENRYQKEKGRVKAWELNSKKSEMIAVFVRSVKPDYVMDLPIMEMDLFIHHVQSWMKIRMWIYI